MMLVTRWLTRLATTALAFVCIGEASAGTVWYVDQDAIGADNGTSWDTAFVDLKNALLVAANGDEIRVAEGVYQPDQGTLLRSSTFGITGQRVYGGYAGVGASDPNMRDIVAYPTVLSGDLLGDDSPGFTSRADNCYHVLTLNGGRVDGLTARGGNANGGGNDDRGGGLRELSAGSALIDCIFTDNQAARYGAGVSKSGGSIQRCQFIGNQLTGPLSGGSPASGGGLAVSNGSGVTDCAFLGNTSLVAVTGVGAYVGREVQMSGCLFQDNLGHGPTDGVGAYISDARVGDCSFIGNTSSDPLSRGGGFYLTMNSDPARVEDCLVVGNSVSQGMGGGFFATAFGGSLPSEVKRTVMVGNRASFGGGAALDHIADIFHCSFHSNTATNTGGGLYLTGFQSPWAPYATDCIVWGNTASGAPTLEQAQVARDPAMPVPPVMHYFDVEGLTPTFPGNGHIGLDPFFVDPNGADDVLGTADDDLNLLLGSPCIDAGSGALDPDGTPPDIGALPFFQPPVPSPWVDLGFGLSGTQGVPVLVASGDLTAGSTATLSLSNGNPFWVVVLVLGLTPIYAPFKTGTLVPFPDDIVFFTTSSNGQLTVAETWPPGIPSGFVFFGQFLSPDPGGPVGWSASNALAGTSP